jgi:hypothetical protein
MMGTSKLFMNAKVTKLEVGGLRLEVDFRPHTSVFLIFTANDWYGQTFVYGCIHFLTGKLQK